MTYPTIMPALTLDFQNSQQLDPRVTFSRSSGATYINSAGLVVSAADHEARFDHDPVTGECLGLLLEESKTNEVRYSEQFDNAVWTKTNMAVTQNNTVAPDGTQSADLLYTTTTGVANTSRNIGAVSSTPYTTSVYLKSAGFTWAFVYGPQGNVKAYFNLITGVIGTVDAGATAAISPAGNGWYKCSVTQTVTYRFFAVGPADVDGSSISTSSGTSGIYAWGAQLEQGFPTSYIPTAGSTIIRSQDIATISGTNFSSWYNQSEGSFVAKVSSSSPEAETFLSILRNDGVEIADGFRIFSSQLYNRAVYYPSGTSNDFINYSPLEGANKLAIAGSGSESSAYFNGIVGTVLASRSPQGFTPDGIKFGSAQPPNGHISRLAYYNERLTDAELQTLTS